MASAAAAAADSSRLALVGLAVEVVQACKRCAALVNAKSLAVLICALLLARCPAPPCATLCFP